MNILFYFWGVLENRMLNPEVIKTSSNWIHKYNKENINIFGYLGAGGGGGDFNNQTGPILVHIYRLIYINLHVEFK